MAGRNRASNADTNPKLNSRQQCIATQVVGKQKPTDEISDLRRRAEKMLAKRPNAQAKILPAEMPKVLHEISVHQIELELQNEELSRTQRDLEAAYRKYYDLYDLAPVGYLNLNVKGVILDANLTAAKLLGTERSQMIKRQLANFIFRKDQDIYYLHRKLLYETRELQGCEVRMVKGDGTHLWVQVESVVVTGDNGESASREAIIDIASRKKMEKELDRYREQLEDVIKERTTEFAIANELLEAFNCTAYNDLQAPLHDMRRLVKLLQEKMQGRLNEEIRECALLISKASMKMEQRLKELLTLSCLGRK